MRNIMNRDSNNTCAQLLNTIIDIDSIIITNHARERLEERWEELGDLNSTIIDALEQGYVETQNGTILQNQNGSKPPSIEVYIPSEHELGLARLVLMQEEGEYTLVTLYPVEVRYVPNSIIYAIN
jgi:hypothetical protein